jgi:hypothetical protein
VRNRLNELTQNLEDEARQAEEGVRERRAKLWEKQKAETKELEEKLNAIKNRYAPKFEELEQEMLSISKELWKKRSAAAVRKYGSLTLCKTSADFMRWHTATRWDSRNDAVLGHDFYDEESTEVVANEAKPLRDAGFNVFAMRSDGTERLYVIARSNRIVSVMFLRISAHRGDYTEVRVAKCCGEDLFSKMGGWGEALKQPLRKFLVKSWERLKDQKDPAEAWPGVSSPTSRANSKRKED